MQLIKDSKKAILIKIILGFLIVLICFLPALYFIYGILHNKYAVVFSDELIHFLGNTSLYMLGVAILLGLIFKNNLIRFALKIIGISSFIYALLHIVAFFIFKKGLDFQDFLKDIFKFVYLNLGFIAFLLLLALFIFSFTKSFYKISSIGKLCLFLSSLHYILSLKNPILISRIFLGVSTLVLIYQLLNLKQGRK